MKIENIIDLRQRLLEARREASKSGVDWQQAMSEFAMQMLAFFPEEVLETSEVRMRLTPDGFMFMLVKVPEGSKSTEEGYDVC